MYPATVLHHSKSDTTSLQVLNSGILVRRQKPKNQPYQNLITHNLVPNMS